MTANTTTRSENKAQVLYGPKDLRLETREISDPAPGEAQVAIQATGLCGSDLHYYVHGRNGAFILKDPMALGHESAGTVVAVGEGVTGVKVGDKVAVEAGVNCGHCRLCNIGRYNLCPSMRYAASAKCYPHQQGTLQTYYNHPARLLHKLPENVTLEQGSLVEPLSVALQGARRAGVTVGQSVLVLGGGAVGLLGCEISKALGATHVSVVDISPERVEFAEREGFANAGWVMPRKPRPETKEEGLKIAKETSTEILEWAGGDLAEGFDVVLECTGVESCMQSAIHCARVGGKVVYIGMGTPDAMLPIAAACFREVDIMGVFRFANTYQDALKLLASGRLPNVAKLVTTRVPLAEATKAFETLIKGKDDEGNMVLKIMIGDY